MNSIRRSLGFLPVIVAVGLVALSPAARAEGEGGGNYMPDRVAEILMEQARVAGMTACEAVLIPIGTDGTFRLSYRVVRAGQPQVPRPANSMTAVVQSSACPR